MKITEYEKIKLQIEMMDLGLLDSFIQNYVNANYEEFEKEFYNKIYKKTSEFNYTRTTWIPDIKFYRMWWLKRKYPELFDKDLISKW